MLLWNSTSGWSFICPPCVPISPPQPRWPAPWLWPLDSVTLHTFPICFPMPSAALWKHKSHHLQDPPQVWIRLSLGMLLLTPSWLCLPWWSIDSPDSRKKNPGDRPECFAHLILRTQDLMIPQNSGIFQMEGWSNFSVNLGVTSNHLHSLSPPWTEEEITGHFLSGCDCLCSSWCLCEFFCPGFLRFPWDPGSILLALSHQIHQDSHVKLISHVPCTEFSTICELLIWLLLLF